MKITGFLHDCYHGFMFWAEGELRYLKRYWPELSKWLLFAACLAALCFVLGFTSGLAKGLSLFQ